MGHIVNAIGIRLGWNLNWCDKWFSELLYYPEYFHSIYRIRFFVSSFFDNCPSLEENGAFFSHYEIIKHYKNLKINIFFYDGLFETLVVNYFHEIFLDYKEIKKDKHSKNLFNVKFISEPLKIIGLFYLFIINLKLKKNENDEEIFILKENELIHQFGKKISLEHYFTTITKRRSSNWYEKIYYKKKFINSFNFLKNKFLSGRYFNNLSKKLNIRLYFFFIFYIYNKQLNRCFDNYNYKVSNDIIKIFLRRLVILFTYKKYFITCQKCIYFFYLKHFSNKFKLSTNFFVIDNDSISARFLARYIARKFQQIYSFFELLNPIRKELKFVCKKGTLGNYTNITKLNKNLSNNIIFFNWKKKKRNQIFKVFLTYLFLNYKKYNLKFFYKYSTYLSINNLPIYIWINKFILKKNFLIKFIFNFSIRRGAFSFFFQNNIKLNINFNDFLYPSKHEQLKYKIDFTGFFFFIYEDFLLNKNIIFNNILKFEKNMYYLRYTQYFFNRYMQYKYWIYNYDSSNYNHLKQRILKFKWKSGLLGYKLQCLGRFSRKQRASSRWFCFKSTPLNTIDANIDYNYWSLPITNSIITIKVWLYKNPIFKNYIQKLI
jgi:hypothetical protein